MARTRVKTTMTMSHEGDNIVVVVIIVVLLDARGQG